MVTTPTLGSGYPRISPRQDGIRTAIVALALVALAGVRPAAAQTAINVAWDPSAGASGYYVFYGTTPGQYSGYIDVGNRTSTQFVPPVANQVYYFTIKAYNAAGQSAPSNEAAAWVGMLWSTPSLLRSADFDGDGRADAMVYRGSTGQWIANRSSDGGTASVGWGSPTWGDVPVPADYGGDGKTDYAVYRPSTGEWFIAPDRHYFWGAPSLGDVPVPADYDGDGKADVAVFRRATGQWLIQQSKTGALRQVNWGAAGDVDLPVPADYDGDGKADIAVYRRTTGQWFILYADLTSSVSVWGSPTHADVPAPADYDGDRKADRAVFRLLDGTWLISLSSGGTRTLSWGAPSLGDVPVPGDYDGDRKADVAVFRLSTGGWYVALTSGGTRTYMWGAPSLGDTVGGVQQFTVVPFK
jgi:hypothetical protein